MHDATSNIASPDAPVRVLARLHAAALAHPIVAASLLALIVRAIVAVVAAPWFSGSAVLDDGTYHDMAAAKATGATEHWDEYTHQLYRQTATFLVPLTWLYEIVGPSEVAGRLLVAAIGAGAVALLVRLALEVMTPRRALVTGILAALLPSGVLWSALILKDATVWLLLAALAVIAAIAVRSTGRTLAAAGAGAGAILLLIGHTRLHTLVIAAWTLMVAAWFGPAAHRALRGLGAAALAAVIPLLVGLGPFGFGFIASAGNLELERRTNAVGAETAIVEPLPPPAPGGLDGVVVSPDPASQVGGGIAADIRHLPRGLAALLFEPLPWRSGGSRAFTYARWESPLWYALLVLALMGLPAAARRSGPLAFPLLAASATLAVYSLTEGNIGTAFRHRGEVAWVVILAAGMGIASLRRRRTEQARS